jgi:AcrR family transcriptional regulator
MAGRKTRQKRSEPAADSQRIVRLIPTQQRSRERFERILACAVEVMAEKGSDAFRMSDIVERTGIAFGSLYQYFPDKTAIIGTLAERYNAIGHECVAKELAALKEIGALHDVLGRIADSYYQFFLDEPAVRDVWQATQADRALQKIDEEDGAYLAGMLMDALRTVTPQASERSLSDFSQMMMVLIAAVVRHAVDLPPKEGRRILALFKLMLPHDLSAIA